MGSFEYYQTSFSYLINDSGEEHFVGVPEQGGRDMISADPLPRAPSTPLPSAAMAPWDYSGLRSLSRPAPASSSPPVG
jgi:hypothetical protein